LSTSIFLYSTEPWRISNFTNFRLSCNQIEGYVPGKMGGLYKRDVVDVYLPNGNVVSAYVYHQEIPKKNKISMKEGGFMKDFKYFENGDWFPEKTNYTGLILIKPTETHFEKEEKSTTTNTEIINKEEEKELTQNSNSEKEDM
jgi:hypothetical protein